VIDDEHGKLGNVGGARTGSFQRRLKIAEGLADLRPEIGAELARFVLSALT
jgi:hypothetical protein